jgi:CHAT domain-containing protein/tetratricopeptide (TPR) repeat protein
VALDLAQSDRVQARRLAAGASRDAGAGPEVLAVAEHALGLVALAEGDLEAATRRLRRSIEVAEGAGLAARAAEARGTLAYALTLTGRTEEALREVDRAMPALVGLSGVRLQMQRALILTELARFDEAAAGFEQTLVALRRAGGSDLVEGDIHTNRSFLRHQVRDWRGAEDDLRRAESRYRAAGHVGRVAMVAHNRGAAAVIRGDLPAAFAAFDEAERGYAAQDRDPGLLPVDRAEALLSVRLVAEARQAAADAVELFSRRHNAVDLVRARLVLAQTALVDRDATTARSEAERARAAAARQRRPGWAALAGHVVLRARWEQGDRTEAALRAGRRTIVRLDRTGWVIPALDARLVVARLALALGRTTSARRMLVDAARARRDGPAELRARAWHAEALVRLSSGDRRGARAALRRGMQVLDRFRASLGASELRAHVSSAGAHLAGLGLELAVESGDPASVFEWAERWRAGAMLVRPARPPDDARLAEDLAALRQAVVEAGTAAAEGGDVRPWLARQAELEEAIRSRARHAPGADRWEARIPSATQVRDALGARAMVEIVALDGDLHAVVLTADRIRLRRLGPMQPVQIALHALRYGLRRLAYEIGTVSSIAAAEQLVDDKARMLDDILLAPLDADVGAPLVIVPTGALHALPWAALPSCRGRPVSLAPSAALWHRAATASPSRSGRWVAAAGPGLPHAAAEVAALAGRYPGASRFTGRRATVGAVSAALDGADLAHLAAHGHLRADNPLFSSIELADGPLTVYDVERLDRPPRDVVLSACDSGVPTVHPGDELLGLAAALLAMGTRSLVATVVPVPDEASRPLMLRFHRHLAAGASPAAALAAAQVGTVGHGHARARAAATGFVCIGAG